jgi:pimeloyl-ACP methyl ester carboxylesterase
MYHSPPEFLTLGKGSTAFFAIDRPDTLIVFVHGFNGRAVATWDACSSILPEDIAFEKCDVLYYGYESLDGQVSDQGRDFYQFLNHYANPRRPAGFTAVNAYQKILVVAHSLGAIVARLGLLEAVDNGDAWRQHCRLLLFAPAHNGARIQNLVLLSLPSLYKILGGLALFMKPVLDDLKPGSPALNALQLRTNACRHTADEIVLRAGVAEARGDKVVHNGKFCFDHYITPTAIDDQSHISVCKPKQQHYTLPVELIKESIQ